MDNQTEPTPDDRAFLWHTASDNYERLQVQFPDKRRQRKIKKALVKFLFDSVPALSGNLKSLRHLFDIKFAAWKVGGRTEDAVRDKRGMQSGNFRKPDFSADEAKIRNEAILHGGNISLAHRKLRERGELSREFMDYYDFNPRRNKSRVAATVREAITPEVEMCGPLHRGPWEAKMRGPYIPRDWSDVYPADWFSGDDITFNHYFYFYDEQGQLHIERGECLVLNDLRTGYVLDWVLIAGKYNSRHIRKLILRTHDTIGLPHCGFYFERGVWKARLIEELDSKNSMHWRETESGLRKPWLGLEVRHTTTPRAKPIEGLIRIWQERQRDEPGFCGFNERSEKMERLQDKIALARRHKLGAATFLLSMEEWGTRLDKCFKDFAADPQNGKMLSGSSPNEAWRNGLQKPPRKLPDNSRYMLSTHCKRVTVRQPGILLTIGGEKMLYCNADTGRFIGREVLVYYHIDFPDLLTVSDLNRQNYFTVKGISLPAMSATKAQFNEVHSAIAGHRKAAKVIYGNIRHPFITTITRDNEQDPAAAELGEFHNRQIEQHETEQAAATRKLRKIQRTAAAAGIAVPQDIRNLEHVQQGLDLQKEVLERIALRQQTTPKDT
jgi:hypothetical protein